MVDKKFRITIADVAREAGVSPMTVSRVINDTGRISLATREHVWKIVDKLGYRPSHVARALVTKKTLLIGVVVPDITNPYFPEIIQGIEVEASQAGYSVLLANTNENPVREKAVLNQIDSSSVDGIIVCSSRLPDDILWPLLEIHHAAVVVNRSIPTHIASCVRTRHGLGYRALQSARYLTEAGHTKIGYIHLKRNAAALDQASFIERLALEGISIQHDWCISCLPNWKEGYNAGQQLLMKIPQLTAIIGGNDLVALGAMRAAIELGRRIPDDLAIIGGDNILMSSQVTPALTTFQAPKYDIGVMAARLLFKRIEGDMTYQEYLYDEELIERGSTR